MFVPKVAVGHCSEERDPFKEVDTESRVDLSEENEEIVYSKVNGKISGSNSGKFGKLEEKGLDL